MARPRTRLDPNFITCRCCGQVKPKTKEHFYFDYFEWVTSACKQCVEERIAAQEEVIKKEVARGERRANVIKMPLDL